MEEPNCLLSTEVVSCFIKCPDCAKRRSPKKKHTICMSSVTYSSLHFSISICSEICSPCYRTKILLRSAFLVFGSFFLKYFIQHCFICRRSDSTVSKDAGIAPAGQLRLRHWQSGSLTNQQDLNHELDLIHELALIHELDLFHELDPIHRLDIIHNEVWMTPLLVEVSTVKPFIIYGFTGFYLRYL